MGHVCQSGEWGGGRPLAQHDEERLRHQCGRAKSTSLNGPGQLSSSRLGPKPDERRDLAARFAPGRTGAELWWIRLWPAGSNRSTCWRPRWPDQLVCKRRHALRRCRYPGANSMARRQSPTVRPSAWALATRSRTGDKSKPAGALGRWRRAGVRFRRGNTSDGAVRSLRGVALGGCSVIEED